nr:reverse transcriptase domain-containing protein [Tanacetum cinerariifolium]
SPIDTMADQRTMEELLRAPTEGYKDLLRACPHHGFTKLHLLDAFYNALNPTDQDSLNTAVGSNLLERRTQDVLTIIENKSKVRNSRNKSVVSQVKSCDANSNSSSEIAKLTHAVNQQSSAVTSTMTAILKQFQATLPSASVKAVEEIFVTCGGAHPYYQCLTAGGNTFTDLRDNIQGYVSTATVNYNQGNFVYRPPAITTRSGIVFDGSTVPIPLPFINPEEDERVEETLTDPDLSEYTIKKLGLPEPISTRMTLELANRAICTPAGIARDVFVPIGKFTFLADFVIIDYESNPRVPLILERHFLRTARALIDVHGEEMILQGGNVLPEKFLDLDSTKDLHHPLHVNPLSGSTTYSSSPNPMLEKLTDELALITFPLEYDDDLQFDMFTDEHALDYSSLPIFDEYDDDFLEVESDTKNVYDDPFDSKG